MFIYECVYIKANPAEKVKEDELFKKLEETKEKYDKELESDPVKKAEAIAAFEKAKLNAIDIEKLVRKE